MKRQIILITVCSVVTCLAATCKENEFFNEHTLKCQACKVCQDMLLSRICSGTQDTICEGFSGLNFSFLGPPRNRGLVPPDKKVEIESPTVLQSNEDEAYWKTLAFALIGILSLLVMITTVVVVFTCHRFRNYSWLCKGVTQEQAEDAESGGYVIIHRFIPPATSTTPPGASDRDSPEYTHPFVSYHPRNSRLGAYKPKRRLMNEYVDDVFESDDSAGSRTLRSPLATILEKSDCESPDSPHSAST